MLKFILRLDDICPRMDWAKFLRLKKTIDAYNLKPLIGVIPDNKDVTLMPDPPKKNFWTLMRKYQRQGWTIAQHGFEHLYHTKDGGMFDISTQAEFAGLSLQQQVEMLAKGRAILKYQGLESDIFMAPSHSMDWNTVAALKMTNFKYVTDGYGLYPYEQEGLIFVPQLFESGLNFGKGIYTLCLHTNQMDTEKHFQKLEAFIVKNAAHFISFPDSYQYIDNGFFNKGLADNFFRCLRKGKTMLTKAES